MHTTLIQSDDSPPPFSPRRAEAVGMWLFLAALAMLFFAAMLGYLIVRGRMAEQSAAALHVPWPLWASTVVLIVSSLFIERAKRLVQREKQSSFRRAMIASLVLSVLFVLVQTPSLISLLETHAEMKATGVGLYGLVFVLITLHALHILGGLIPLFITTRKALRGTYDHEQYAPVARLAMYWPFLDVVWLLMFAVFVVVG